MWALWVLVLSLALGSHALVTCPCERFNDTTAIYTSCVSGTGPATVGQSVSIIPVNVGQPDGANWTATVDLFSIDLCGSTQAASHQPEVLHGFSIVNPGMFRIETFPLHTYEDDYTVVLQLETGYPDGYYESGGVFVDQSKKRCNIGQTKDGNSYQAQVTEYLLSRYYVVIIEAKPGSVNKPNVGFKLTRVEQTSSPSRSPSLPTRAPTSKQTDVVVAPTTLAPTAAVTSHNEPATSTTSPAASIRMMHVWMYMVVMVAMMVS